MWSPVNDTLNHGASSSVTVSPYREVCPAEPYILPPVRIGPASVNLSVLCGLTFFWSRVALLHRSSNLSPRHARRNFLASLYLARILHQLSSLIKHQSIPSL